MTWKMLLLAGMVPAALCTASLAQPPAAPMPPATPPGMGRPHPPMMPPSPEMLARRADDTALLIGLRADQRPALDALLQPPAPPPAPPALGAQEEGFLQRLDREERRAAEHAEREKQHLDTLRAFYAKLDAQQKARFEALMRLSHGPEGMGPPPPPPGGPGLGERP